jgi:hypothetical protein
MEEKEKTPKPDIVARLRSDFGDLLISDETYEELIETDRTQSAGRAFSEIIHPARPLS